MMYIESRKFWRTSDMRMNYYIRSDVWETARDMTPSSARADALGDDSLALRIPGCRVRNRLDGRQGILVLFDESRSDGVLIRSLREGCWVWQGTEVEYVSAWIRD